MSLLDIIGKGHGREAIHYFVKETKMVHLSSLQVFASPTGATMK